MKLLMRYAYVTLIRVVWLDFTPIQSVKVVLTRIGEMNARVHRPRQFKYTRFGGKLGFLERRRRVDEFCNG